jgi:hypothetical protein
MKGWNAVLLLSGSTEHLSGATTGGRDRNCKRKLMHFAWYPKHPIFMKANLTLNFMLFIYLYLLSLRKLA